MKRLTPAERAAYEREGTLFPLPALDAREVAKARAAVEALLALASGPDLPPLGQTHLFFAPIHELVSHPAVLDAIEDVIGPDIAVHSTTIFAKTPGDGKFVTWHQDGHYWRLDEPRLASAWIALTDSNPANGCVRVIPRSHHVRVPHRERKQEDNLLRSGLELEVDVDESLSRDVVLRAGELSLHHVNLVHSSKPNTSSGPRIGFAVRYVSPLVRQEVPHHHVVLVRGRRGGTYRFADAPQHGIADGLAPYLDFRRERVHA